MYLCNESDYFLEAAWPRRTISFLASRVPLPKCAPPPPSTRLFHPSAPKGCLPNALASLSSLLGPHLNDHPRIVVRRPSEAEWCRIAALHGRPSVLRCTKGPDRSTACPRGAARALLSLSTFALGARRRSAKRCSPLLQSLRNSRELEIVRDLERQNLLKIGGNSGLCPREQVLPPWQGGEGKQGRGKGLLQVQI